MSEERKSSLAKRTLPHVKATAQGLLINATMEAGADLVTGRSLQETATNLRDNINPLTMARGAIDAWQKGDKMGAAIEVAKLAAVGAAFVGIGMLGGWAVGAGLTALRVAPAAVGALKTLGEIATVVTAARVEDGAIPKFVGDMTSAAMGRRVYKEPEIAETSSHDATKAPDPAKPAHYVAMAPVGKTELLPVNQPATQSATKAPADVKSSVLAGAPAIAANGQTATL